MKTKDIVLISLFTAIIAALGMIPLFFIPLVGVPITAQSIGPMLAGALLDRKRGALVLLLFCSLTFIGLPLLSGARGGVAVFYGPTGGFILSWILAAWLIGGLYQWLQPQRLFLEVLILLIGGIVLVYVVGFAWYSYMSQTPFTDSLIASWVLLPGDCLKLALVISIRRLLMRTGVLSILR